MSDAPEVNVSIRRAEANANANAISTEVNNSNAPAALQGQPPVNMQRVVANNGAAFLSNNEAAENTLEEFEKKERDKRTFSGLEQDIENSTLSELRQRIERDDDDKSTSYRLLIRGLNMLLDFKNNNERVRNGGEGRIIDYGDALDVAEGVFRNYKVTHTKLFHFTKKGRERYRISCRLQELTIALRQEINKSITRENKKKEYVGREVKQDFEEIIDTGAFTPEEAGKEMRDWLANGREYKDTLKRIVRGDDELKGDRETLLKFLENKNRLLIANKMTLSMMIDEHPELTQGIPALKERLKVYIDTILSSSEENKEKIYLEVKDFRDFVDEKLAVYGDENKDLLDMVKSRKVLLIDRLNAQDEETLWSREEVSRILMDTDLSDEAYIEKLEILGDQKKENEELIDSLINSGKYAGVTKKAIKAKLSEKLGSLMIFGSETNVAEAAKRYMDVLHYLCPDEATMEDRISDYLKGYNIPEIYRNSLVIYLAGRRAGDAAPKKILDEDLQIQAMRVETFVSNLNSNAKILEKKIENKNFTENQWKRIEVLDLYKGCYSKTDNFKRELNDILNDLDGDIEISRDEYKRGIKDKKRGIGLSGRILGDLFIDNGEVRTILSDEELSFLKENLIAEIAGDEETRLMLEGSTTSELKALASKMKKNLSDNADRIEELRQSDAYDDSVKLKTILKLVTAGYQVTEQVFNRILADEDTEYKEGKQLEEEMRDVQECMNGIPKDDAVSLKTRKLERRLIYLKSYEGGRFAPIADFLVNKKDIYYKIMNLPEEGFFEYVADDLNRAYAPLGEALKVLNTREAIKKVFLERHFEDIYSGKLTGDPIVWKKRVSAFEDQLFSEKQADGNSISSNIEKAVNKAFEKIVEKKGKKAYSLDAVWAISNLMTLNALKEKNGLEKFMNAERIEEEILRSVERQEVNANAAMEMLRLRLADVHCPFNTEDANTKLIREGQFRRFIRGSIFLGENEFLAELPKLIIDFEEKQSANKTYTEQNKLPDDAENIKREVQDKTDPAHVGELKRTYLGLNSRIISDTLNDIYMKKSLVNIGTDYDVDLSHASQDVAREHLTARLSELTGENLTPFIIDCLVEKNVTSRTDEIINRVKPLKWVVRKFIDDGFEKLREHAVWLSRVRSVLSRPDDGEDPISEDEINMMIVNIYRNEEKFRREEDKEGHSFKKDDIKGAWYTQFRKNYKALKEFESIKIDDPLIEQERTGLSRDYRALLSTGLAITDQDDNGTESIASLIEKGTKYINGTDKIQKIIRQVINGKDNYKDRDEYTKSNYILAVRAFYTEEITRQLTAGNELNEEEWKQRIDGLVMDETRMHFILNDDVMVRSDLSEKNKNFGETVGRDAIDKAIEKYAWRSQRKKYNSLTTKQKELFAFALMVMDKSAIGLEGGSNTVLQDSSLRKKETGAKILELKKYMNGEPYDFKIDYAQAVCKLTNFGNNSVNSLKTKLSDKAFDKAFEFAEGIAMKMNVYTEEDMQRADDSESIIMEAQRYDKSRNANEANKLRKGELRPADVKSKFLEFAEKDKETLDEKIGFSKYVPFRNRALKKEDELREKMVKRIQEMDELDMKKLICVLQNRSALDKSKKKKGASINPDRREELKLMFMEENEESVFSGFMTNESGYQALLSALSFKVSDEKRIGRRPLGKGDFDNASFDRASLIDWKLIKRAFDFLDEVKKDRLAAYAVKNVTDYIESSGNKAAIAEYEQLKDNKKMSSDELEDFIKEQAVKDTKSKENEDAMIAIGGFRRLNERQKALFFRVLQNRDYLDISKKNLYRNIWSSQAERGFVNELGRYRLIDEYIDKSMGGNKGITLGEGEYYNAMKALLSTQVDDTADFKNASNVRKVLAGEKCYIFQRSTAIDWKLFNRALQFVNRADYELKLREGNAELYRSAGSLSKYGHLSMDYSILRKNIHNTGNQFFRFGVQRGKETLGPEILNKLKIAGIKPGEVIGGVAEVCANLFSDTKFGDVMSELKSELIKGETQEKYYSKGAKKEKMSKGPKTVIYSPGEINKKTKEDRDEKKKKEITYIDHVKTCVSNIFENGKVMEKGAEEVGNLLSTLVVNPVKEEKKKDTKKKSDPLSEQYKGMTVKKRYGDIRDTFVSFRNKYQKVEKVQDTISKLPVISDYETKLINLVKVNVVENVCKAMFEQGGSLKGMLPALEKGYKRQKELKFEELKKSTLKKLIKEKKVPEGYQFTEEDINSRKYWKKEDEELNDEDRLKAAEDTAKDYFEGVLKGIFGEKKLKTILDTVKNVENVTDMVREKVTEVTSVIDVAKNYGALVLDIAQRAKNKKTLSSGKERAGSDETRENDERTLREAERYQTDTQKDQVSEIVEHHRDMQKMAGETADTIQNIEISRDVLNIAIQTGELIAEAHGVSSKVMAPIVGAVRMGVDFALYVARVLKDRSMLEDYYSNTNQGRAVYESIVDATNATFGREEVEASNSDMQKGRVLNIVRIGSGYENMDELVRDTGMKIATSIAFSASNYNPVMENKIMASTVLVVLGMRDKIGKTDAGTISDIFNAMKAA